MPEVPLYDDAGINLADPHDARGHKTAYISHLQIEGLRRVLGPVSGVAADAREAAHWAKLARDLPELRKDQRDLIAGMGL